MIMLIYASNPFKIVQRKTRENSENNSCKVVINYADAWIDAFKIIFYTV